MFLTGKRHVSDTQPRLEKTCTKSNLMYGISYMDGRESERVGSPDSWTSICSVLTPHLGSDLQHMQRYVDLPLRSDLVS